MPNELLQKSRKRCLHNVYRPLATVLTSNRYSQQDGDTHKESYPTSIWSFDFSSEE